MELEGLGNNTTIIRIHDILGKMVKEIEVDPTTDIKFNLNLGNDLRSGMYYIHVHNDNKKVSQAIIITQ